MPKMPKVVERNPKDILIAAMRRKAKMPLAQALYNKKRLALVKEKMAKIEADIQRKAKK